MEIIQGFVALSEAWLGLPAELQQEIIDLLSAALDFPFPSTLARLSMGSKSLHSSMWSKITGLKVYHDPSNPAKDEDIKCLNREGLNSLTMIRVLALPVSSAESVEAWSAIANLVTSQTNLRSLSLQSSPSAGFFGQLSSRSDWSANLASLQISIYRADISDEASVFLAKLTSLRKLNISCSFGAQNEEMDNIRQVISALPNLMELSDGSAPPEDVSIFAGFTRLTRLWIPAQIHVIYQHLLDLIRNLRELKSTTDVEFAVDRYFGLFRSIFPENIPHRISFYADLLSMTYLSSAGKWVEHYIRCVLRSDRNPLSGPATLLRIGLVAPNVFPMAVGLIDRPQISLLLSLCSTFGSTFKPKKGNDPVVEIEEALRPLIEPSISRLCVLTGVDRATAAVSIFGPTLVQQIASSYGIPVMQPFLQKFELYGIRDLQMCKIDLWKYCKNDDDAEFLLRMSAPMLAEGLDFLTCLSRAMRDRVLSIMPIIQRTLSINKLGESTFLDVVCSYFRLCCSKLSPEKATELFKLQSGEHLLKGICVAAIWDIYLFNIGPVMRRLHEAGFVMSSTLQFMLESYGLSESVEQEIEVLSILFRLGVQLPSHGFSISNICKGPFSDTQFNALLDLASKYEPKLAEHLRGLAVSKDQFR